MRRVIFLAVFAILATLLHLWSATPPALADPSTCTLNPTGLDCGPTYASPELLNPGALSNATADQAASLRRLSAKAIDNTLADHQLPESDRAAVESWGRNDAEGELFALIVDAINTSAAQRTADQQNAVDWMGELLRAQAQSNAEQVGEEYVRWAGLNLGTYRNLLDTRASEADLKTFLSGNVTPYDNPDIAHATSGYCKYRSPAPYGTEYNGWTDPTCSAPCPSVLGCNPPTPSYDQFVKWGTAAGTDERLQTSEYAASASDIAAGITFSAAAVTAAAIGLVIATTTVGLMASTGIAASLFAFTALEASLIAAGQTAAEVAASGVAASGGGAAATAIGGTVAIVILAIVIAVMQGITVGNAAALPGKIASLVAGSRTLAQDVPAVLATTAGATSIYGMFVGATLPLPRSNEKCDNSLIPPTAYLNGLGFTVVYLPLGTGVHEEQISTRPCLNPPDVPPAATTDPHFVVHNAATHTVTDSPTLTVLNESSGATTVARVHGNWFIAEHHGPTADYEYQSLRLDVTNWSDQSQRVWLVKDGTGRYQFLGVAADTTTALDPNTCEALDLCWTSRTLQYVGPGGTKLEASLELFAPSVGSASVDTLETPEPMEGSPVAFQVNGFRPATSVGEVIYTWRFQREACAVPCTTVIPNPGGPGAPGGGLISVPLYSDPVAFPSPNRGSHTWQTSGTFMVELTATDQGGHQAVTEFPVRVASVAPQLAIDPVRATTRPGDQVTLHGTVDHVGTLDNERVDINWGDGSPQDSVSAGRNVVNLAQPLKLESSSPTRFDLTAPHTYTQPGTYYGTVTVVNGGGDTDVETFIYDVPGPQTIDFAQIPASTYGDTLDLTATGGGSGNPVTYTASPSSVCTANGTNGARIKLVGVGNCEVTASQAGNGVLDPATPVTRTFGVQRAQLTITADDVTTAYGADAPAFTASYDGLANGDTKTAITGLVLSGAPTGSDVGQYPIVASGASSPNYDITLVNGTETITRAALRITAVDKTKVYGGPDPTFSATYDGFVNGDSPADITGLQIAAAPTGADAGQHPIVPSGASSSHYAITYVNGTETIKPAPLTVTAADQTKVYGADDPAFTASADGLVNGDTETDLTGLKVSGAPKASGVGSYPITASGVTNGNYDITYVDGAEHITAAALTITADDQTRVYGADDPAYTASYDGLVNGDTKSAISGLVLAGAPTGSHVGSYPITASGATNGNYDISYADGTEHVTQAPLIITADDKTKVYGADDPTFTASFDGLVNGDARTDVPGLVLAGAPTTAGVGLYLIQPSGAHNPDYDITFEHGTEQITQAPLKITADDKTKVYGATDPTFTAKIDGLVNGDTTAAITGLTVTGAPTGSDVGTYPIVPSGAANPNYDVTFVNGRETVTAASLMIKADDKTAKFGTVAAYTWTGSGWVNGDKDATIDTAPTCSATVQGAAASVTTAPGAYPGAITCSGAVDGNYTIGYTAGKLTVDPVITLDQTGLPAGVAKNVKLDGTTVALPVTAKQVGYGTAHSFGFPAYVADSTGVVYITTTSSFSGPVVTNLTVTATYGSTQQTITIAIASGGIDANYAKTLTSAWAVVEKQIKAGKSPAAISALHDYASAVRAQSGKKITRATATALLAMAQAVYASLGGTGTV